MACREFDRVLAGTAGDHALRCPECAALLESLADADKILESALSGVSAPPGLAAAARARIAAESRRRGPSIVPELLDFIGWAAVLALAAVLFPRVWPVLRAALQMQAG
jgi:hypothetical protein